MLTVFNMMLPAPKIWVFPITALAWVSMLPVAVTPSWKYTYALDKDDTLSTVKVVTLPALAVMVPVVTLPLPAVPTDKITLAESNVKFELAPKLPLSLYWICPVEPAGCWKSMGDPLA